jgi:alkylation response protein AidB-like acyl-CoA dehydrogenase
MTPADLNNSPGRSEASDGAPPFSEYLQNFKESLKQVFHVREDIDQLSVVRGLPPYVLRDLMACSPLSTFIPEEYGGRGGKSDEGIAIVEAASYESLALSLVFGINWALFIQPVTKYCQEEARKSVLEDFVRNRKMGGLMITEPGYGSDALHMQSFWTEEGDHCRLQGTKHWAGLTGWADYWLLTARKASSTKGLGRDIDFFVCDANAPGQNIVVEEKFNNLGLYMIPYGRNRIDVRIPATHRLTPETTGVKMMLDLLHRSRMQFPAMAMGFIRRILDEATEHCRNRQVGGKNLLSYDMVQSRLANIQSAFTVCSAMCLNTSEKAGIENNLAGEGLEANCVKTYITDLMQESAQSLLQLVGAIGYRLDHFAGRAIVDCRPFQIFEGSNDILNVQITEAVLKQMSAVKEKNLFRYLSQLELTRRSSSYFKKILDFEINPSMTQRKQVVMGELISRVVNMDMVMRLGERGFSKELVASCITNLQQEVSRRVADYRFENCTGVIDLEQDHPAWRSFCL